MSYHTPQNGTMPCDMPQKGIIAMPHAIKRHHASATRHNKGPCRVTRHQNVASELGVVGDLVGHHRAGSGADASPYFRIFNPFSQGEKFDPNGDYVRKYVPELAKMPNKYIHRPWDAPEKVLNYAGVVLGKTYPKPIVNHKVARERALAAYKDSRSSSSSP